MRKSRITLMNLNKILRSKRGETLMEGIVSILIFTILIAAVTLMLNWAQRETGETIREGQNLQALADDALTGEFAEDGYDVDLNEDENIDLTKTDIKFTLTVTEINGEEVEEKDVIEIDGTGTDFNNDEFVAFFVPPPGSDKDENGDDDEEEDEDGEGEGDGDDP